MNKTLPVLVPTRDSEDHHDFRDVGNPLEKVYPEPDWRGWERRQDQERDINER